MAEEEIRKPEGGCNSRFLGVGRTDLYCAQDVVIKERGEDAAEHEVMFDKGTARSHSSG